MVASLRPQRVFSVYGLLLRTPVSRPHARVAGPGRRGESLKAMYEDRPEKDTPESVQTELREYGGLSPDGQPLWRVVLAQNCRIHCFGTRNHVDPGKVAALGDNSRPTDLEADRVEDGEHWLPRFRFKGWVLQRWFPVSVWGTRERWEGEKARDGRTRLMAAYPQRGAYMMMAGPWPTIAQAGDLKGAIRCYNVQQRNNPVNWPNHIQAMAVFEEQERKQLTDNYADEIAAQHRLGLEHVLRSVSPAAQEFRNVVANHTAGGVNLGASEKWG